MTDLITRLTTAGRGSDELDADVWEATGHCAHREVEQYTCQDDWGFHCKACGEDPHRPFIPKASQSTDAALALIEERLPGWAWWIDFVPEQTTRAKAALNEPGKHGFVGHAKTPALALCSALLTALAANP